MAQRLWLQEMQLIEMLRPTDTKGTIPSLLNFA
jgi:hypothetical protein